MPIEVRELIIRTNVDSNSTNSNRGAAITEASAQKLKQRILKECQDMIRKEVKKSNDR